MFIIISDADVLPPELGAVKMGAVLPWELDADIGFLGSNVSALKNLSGVFADSGYELEVRSLEPVMRGKRIVHGSFGVNAGDWRTDVNGVEDLESAMLVASGKQPTRLRFVGQWVTVMRNPGLYARNHYYREIYRHHEHNSFMWKFYRPSRFPKCPNPGHFACLDRYSTDGNMQFGK